MYELNQTSVGACCGRNIRGNSEPISGQQSSTENNMNPDSVEVVSLTDVSSPLPLVTHLSPLPIITHLLSLEFKPPYTLVRQSRHSQKNECHSFMTFMPPPLPSEGYIYSVRTTEVCEYWIVTGFGHFCIIDEVRILQRARVSPVTKANKTRVLDRFYVCIPTK